MPSQQAQASLVYSSVDMLAYVAQLQKRAKAEVGKLIQERKPPQPGQRGFQLMQAVKAIHDRYEKGDYRHTSAEAGVCVELANWLIQQHAERHGHPPRFVVADLKAFEVPSTRAVDPGTYRKILYKTFYTREIDDVLDSVE